MKKWTLVLVPRVSPHRNIPNYGRLRSRNEINDIICGRVASAAENSFSIRPSLCPAADLTSSFDTGTIFVPYTTDGLINLPDLTIFRWDGRRAAALPAPPPPGATSSLLRCKSTLIIIWTHYDHCCNFHPIETQVVWKWANNQPLRLPS